MARGKKIPTEWRVPANALSCIDAPHVRRVLSPRRAVRANLELADPCRLTLPTGMGPFHFSRHVTRLCTDICRQIDGFTHIDMSRVLVTFVRARNARSWGNQAKLVPLRFGNGSLWEKRHGHRYFIQQFYVGNVQQSYVLTFYLPRFLNQSFEEKLVTIFHELFHIAPDFAGDIRRLDGAYWIHSHSQQAYDEAMAKYARQYLALRPDPELVDFLRLQFAQLQELYGQVVGVHVPAPKLIPNVPESAVG